MTCNVVACPSVNILCEVDPTSWTGLRVSQARVRVLLATIPVLVPVNFSFPSIPPPDVKGGGKVDHLDGLTA